MYYWKYFFDVYIHSLLTKMACWCNSISPCSTDSFETHLFRFYLYVTLWTANGATLFKFNFYGQWLSQCCVYAIFVFKDSKWDLNFCCVFLPIFTAYHVTFYSVVETSTLHQVVFNRLILYKNLPILYVLAGEFQLKFQIHIFKRIT